MNVLTGTVEMIQRGFNRPYTPSLSLWQYRQSYEALGPDGCRRSMSVPLMVKLETQIWQWPDVSSRKRGSKLS